MDLCCLERVLQPACAHCLPADLPVAYPGWWGLYRALSPTYPKVVLDPLQLARELFHHISAVPSLENNYTHCTQYLDIYFMSTATLQSWAWTTTVIKILDHKSQLSQVLPTLGCLNCSCSCEKSAHPAQASNSGFLKSRVNTSICSHSHALSLMWGWRCFPSKVDTSAYGWTPPPLRTPQMRKSSDEIQHVQAIVIHSAKWGWKHAFLCPGPKPQRCIHLLERKAH